MSYCLNNDCQHRENSSQDQLCQSCGSKLLLRERYRALKMIGQGGFGKTFLAVDNDKPSKPPCVIKQFFPSSQGTNSVETATELFNEEASRLEELGQHSQIPALLAHFEQEGNSYLVQEYINGDNLAQELKTEGVFTEAKIRDLLLGLLPVVQFVHENNVIHRDIKPENIIIQQENEEDKFFLVDFGAARHATGTAILKTGAIIGDPRYIAPEQLLGRTNFSSDLYCLGLSCIHLLTGVDTFTLFSSYDDAWVWRDYLTTSVSDELGQILDKMVQKAIKKRFKTALEILKLLNPSKTPPNISSPPVINTPEISPINPSNPVINTPETSPNIPSTSVPKDKIISTPVTTSIQSQPVDSQPILSPEKTKPSTKIVLDNQKIIPPVVPISIGNKWGYKDQTGETVTIQLLDDVKEFSEDIEGWAKVCIDNKWGYINENLEVVVEPQFDEIELFSDGLAKVRVDNKWGYIDKTGQTIIPIEFDYISPFSEGLAGVRVDNKWGYIDKTGQIIIPIEFYQTKPFSEGLAGVRVDNKWGYIDKTGQIIVPIEFDGISPFSEGLAKVKVNTQYNQNKGKYDCKYGYINKTGEIVIKPKFIEADGFENGRALVTKKGLFSTKKGYINKQGKFID